MYRSGDLARVLSDGSLDYVGRSDAQVKVNGYRVEPAEIEFVVSGCPGVGECAVVVVSVGGADRVVAYVVPVPGWNWIRWWFGSSWVLGCLLIWFRRISSGWVGCR